MIEKYENIINEFLLKQIPFFTFKTEIDEYLKKVNPAELQDFSDFIIDNSFVEFDPDMVMLVNLYLWMFPNRLNKLCRISGADNMFLSFIKSVLDDYKLDHFSKFEIINDNMNYIIAKKGEIHIILNLTDMDINIPLIDDLKNKKVYCINCGDEFETEDKIELYPYGFYLLDNN